MMPPLIRFIVTALDHAQARNDTALAALMDGLPDRMADRVARGAERRLWARARARGDLSTWAASLYHLNPAWQRAAGREFRRRLARHR